MFSVVDSAVMDPTWPFRPSEFIPGDQTTKDIFYGLGFVLVFLSVFFVSHFAIFFVDYLHSLYNRLTPESLVSLDRMVLFLSSIQHAGLESVRIVQRVEPDPSVGNRLPKSLTGRVDKLTGKSYSLELARFLHGNLFNPENTRAEQEILKYAQDPGFAGLVNLSGAGKTNALLGALSQSWGLYLNANADAIDAGMGVLLDDFALYGEQRWGPWELKSACMIRTQALVGARVALLLYLLATRPKEDLTPEKWLLTQLSYGPLMRDCTSTVLKHLCAFCRNDQELRKFVSQLCRVLRQVPTSEDRGGDAPYCLVMLDEAQVLLGCLTDRIVSTLPGVGFF